MPKFCLSLPRAALVSTVLLLLSLNKTEDETIPSIRFNYRSHPRIHKPFEKEKQTFWEHLTLQISWKKQRFRLLFLAFVKRQNVFSSRNTWICPSPAELRSQNSENHINKSEKSQLQLDWLPAICLFFLSFIRIFEFPDHVVGYCEIETLCEMFFVVLRRSASKLTTLGLSVPLFSDGEQVWTTAEHRSSS